MSWAAISGRLPPMCRRSCASVAMPLGYRAEVLGEAAERSAASSRLLLYSLIAAAVVFILLQTTFGTWRLTVLAFVTMPMALAGGAISAYYFGRHSVARIVGGLSHGARHQRPQLHHDDQPLPASRARRGRALRPEPCAARCRGADLPHHHDSIGHGLCPRPDAGRRRHPWAGDRIPDGAGHHWAASSLPPWSTCSSCPRSICALPRASHREATSRARCSREQPEAKPT